MERSALRQLFLLLMLIVTGSPAAEAQATEYSPSLHYSCVDDTFLSVSVSAPLHDSFVNLGLGLVDPHGRSAGSGHHGDIIPRSRYGKVVEIPPHPEMSKAIAVEICGAMPGSYLIEVSEHGSFDYRLSVTGDDGTNSNQSNETQPVNLHSDGDRMCHFRFRFRMAKGKVGDSVARQHWPSP